MSKQVYLFGNGINRQDSVGCSDKTSNNAVSWECLLKELNKTLAGKKINNIEEKEFPFAYEEIKARVDNENELSNKIKCLLQDMKSNGRYVNFPRLEADAILTTNYEYLIEKSINPDWERQKFAPTTEKKYSLYRMQKADGRDIWHIHGEQAMKSSIMLGFKHYIDYSSELRNRAMAWVSQQGKCDKKSWVDYFFTHNVHIVGLGMSYAEYPLWWLLSYRSMLLKSQEKDTKQRKEIPSITNEVNFLICKNEQLASEEKKHHTNTHETLRALDVKVQDIKAKGWDHFYELILTNQWRENATCIE